MARQKEFDTTQVLERAMQVFWCRGYEATSLQDLVEQMGINRQSLYDTYGDKHRLYVAALRRYIAVNATAFCEQLAQPGPVKATLRQLFDELVRDSVGDTQRRGCFIVNAAIELAPHDPEIGQIVLASLEHTRAAFAAMLGHAQQNGEVSARHDPQALAEFLLNGVNGLRVTARTTTDAAALQRIVDVMLSVLD